MNVSIYDLLFVILRFPQVVTCNYIIHPFVCLFNSSYEFYNPLCHWRTCGLFPFVCLLLHRVIVNIPLPAPWAWMNQRVSLNFSIAKSGQWVIMVCVFDYTGECWPKVLVVVDMNRQHCSWQQLSYLKNVSPIKKMESGAGSSHL
jgi:hypothetical protein